MLRSAKPKHADKANRPIVVHTGGGVDVRSVCPLASLLKLDCGLLRAPAVHFFGEVVQ